MKVKILYLLTLLILSSAVCFAQTPQNPELATEINRLYELDQSVQTDMISAYQNGATKEKFDELDKIKNETFKKHIPLLKEIIRKYGFPTFNLVGKESSNNFFAMVQHSDFDLKFQKACLKKIKKFVKTKQVNTANFAYLTDRVSINSGKPQIYGTQLDYDKDGNALPKNLKDAENVNKRRSSVGLESIEEYLKKMTELHKQMNQKEKQK